jgi:hypothetical protein
MKSITLRFRGNKLEDVRQGLFNSDDTAFNYVRANFLGKGMFCNAFKGEDGKVYLLIKEFQNDFDYSKEAIAQWGDSDNRHVPSIETFGQYTVNGKEYLVFRMPFYEKLTSKNIEAWKTFKALKHCENLLKFSNEYSNLHPSFKYYQISRDIIEKACIGEEYKQALTSILEAGSNYGSEYALEFSKVNLSIDGEGNLIFRDVLFNSGLCSKIHEARHKKYVRAY